MSKIYKYGFWVVLILLVTFLNLWFVSKKSFNEKNNFFIQKNENRISFLLASHTILDRRIEPIIGKDIITEEKRKFPLIGNNLVILLEKFKCDQCQREELEKLSNIIKKNSISNVNVIGITIQSERNTLIMHKKIGKIKFPLIWIEDDTFYKQISIDKKYPQILLIKDNVVVSAFISIPHDTEFSDVFYDSIIKKLNAPDQ